MVKLNWTQSQKIYVVSHDAGGAEVLSAWVQENSHHEITFILDGPAADIFKRKLHQDPHRFTSLTQPPIPLDHVDCILTGSSWQSSLELDWIQKGQQNQIPVVSFLDHWSEYKKRFTNGQAILLPDEIWVGDSYALEIAEQCFPKTTIRLYENPFFKEIQTAYWQRQQQHSAEIPQSVLFICEPISELASLYYQDANYYGVHEIDLLQKFIEFLRNQSYNMDRFIIRPHPSEPPGKYEKLLSKYSSQLPITIRTQTTLLEEYLLAKWVVGFDSMALVLALQCGKKVSSCLPKHSPFRTLPFKEIEYI